MTRWNPTFAYVPVERLILQHQDDYYEAIARSTNATDSGIFVTFMLHTILAALKTLTPQVTPKLPLKFWHC